MFEALVKAHVKVLKHKHKNKCFYKECACSTNSSTLKMLEAQAQAPLYKFHYSDQQLLNSDKQRLKIVHQDSELKILNISYYIE